MIAGEHGARLLHLPLHSAVVIGNWASATEPKTHVAEEPAIRKGIRNDGKA